MTPTEPPPSEERFVPVWYVEEVGGDELLQGDVAGSESVAGVFRQRNCDEEQEENEQVDENCAEDGPERGGGGGGAAVEQMVAMFLVERHLALQL